MDQDRVTGGVKSVAGKAEETIGDLTGDAKTKAGGMIDDTVGQIQSGVGRAKDNLRSTIDNLSEQARSAASGVQDQMGSAGETVGRHGAGQPAHRAADSGGGRVSNRVPRPPPVICGLRVWLSPRVVAGPTRPATTMMLFRQRS